MEVDKDDDGEAVNVPELGDWSSFFSSSFLFSSFSRLLFLVRLTLVSSSKKGRPKFKASDASNDETINTVPSAMTNDSLFARNFKPAFHCVRSSYLAFNRIDFQATKINWVASHSSCHPICLCLNLKRKCPLMHQFLFAFRPCIYQSFLVTNLLGKSY